MISDKTNDPLYSLVIMDEEKRSRIMDVGVGNNLQEKHSKFPTIKYHLEACIPMLSSKKTQP